VAAINPAARAMVRNFMETLLQILLTVVIVAA
jgi:hypothetical protein